MLVISRKPNQGIVIGEGIVLRIVEVRVGRVKLGIQAPADMPIVRAEVAGRQTRQGVESETQHGAMAEAAGD